MTMILFPEQEASKRSGFHIIEGAFEVLKLRDEHLNFNPLISAPNGSQRIDSVVRLSSD